MRPLLLDTHIWLWTLVTPERLPLDLRELLAQSAQDVVLSAASTWELSIKYAIGKMPLPESPRHFVGPRLVRDSVRFLPIELRHTVEVAELPQHHHDPFDRLLVVQARVEGMKLVTADAVMEQYEVDLWKV